MKPRQERGDCYRAAGRLLWELAEGGDEQALLCHGIVTGQRGLHGISFGHAWVEMPLQLGEREVQMVLDRSNGGVVLLPRCLYYILGSVNPRGIQRYTMKQMAERASRLGHWGPW